MRFKLIRRCLDEYEQVLNVVHEHSRKLTKEEWDIVGNFSERLARSIFHEVGSDSSAAIAHIILEYAEQAEDFLSRFNFNKEE